MNPSSFPKDSTYMDKVLILLPSNRTIHRVKLARGMGGAARGLISWMVQRTWRGWPTGGHRAQGLYYVILIFHHLQLPPSIIPPSLHPCLFPSFPLLNPFSITFSYFSSFSPQISFSSSFPSQSLSKPISQHSSFLSLHTYSFSFSFPPVISLTHTSWCSTSFRS